MVTRARVFMMLFWLLKMIEAKGLCHRVKDISIDICHLDGLLGFNQSVFE